MKELIVAIGMILCLIIMGTVAIIYMLYPYLYGKQLIKIAELELKRKELEKEEKGT